MDIQVTITTTIREFPGEQMCQAIKRCEYKKYADKLCHVILLTLIHLTKVAIDKVLINYIHCT